MELQLLLCCFAVGAPCLLTLLKSSENRFASLFEEEEEEVKAAKKEVRNTKSTRTNEKRYALPFPHSSL